MSILKILSVFCVMHRSAQGMESSSSSSRPPAAIPATVIAPISAYESYSLALAACEGDLLDRHRRALDYLLPVVIQLPDSPLRTMVQQLLGLIYQKGGGGVTRNLDNAEVYFSAVRVSLVDLARRTLEQNSPQIPIARAAQAPVASAPVLSSTSSALPTSSIRPPAASQPTTESVATTEAETDELNSPILSSPPFAVSLRSIPSSLFFSGDSSSSATAATNALEPRGRLNLRRSHEDPDEDGRAPQRLRISE